MSVCGKRHGRSIEYCSLPKGHDKKPRTELARGTSQMKRSGLRPRSEKQAKLEARWQRLKTKRMREQRRVHGYTFCERCGKQTRVLAFHHSTYRSRGGSFDDENGELICEGPGSCHEKEHGTPFG